MHVSNILLVDPKSDGFALVIESESSRIHQDVDGSNDAEDDQRPFFHGPSIDDPYPNPSYSGLERRHSHHELHGQLLNVSIVTCPKRREDSQIYGSPTRSSWPAWHPFVRLR